MARIIPFQELVDAPFGHCFIEYRPAPDDSKDLPPEEYLHEAVWMGDDVFLKDCYGCISFGKWSNESAGEYMITWRTWDSRPEILNSAWKEE